jgi:hypothetical protein
MFELTARHGRGRRGNGMGPAWARHAICESALRVKYDVPRTERGRSTSLTGKELRGRTGHVFNSRQSLVAVLKHRET